MPKWTLQDIPDQSGKIAIVTGANSGLGYFSSLALADKGATVVMASRDETKAKSAIKKLKLAVPRAEVTFMSLNLADLNSVRDFANEFKNRFSRLNILLNNAGIMSVPEGQTAQGFELQFGTNHLGHFALTGHLLEILTDTPESRVVTTSSFAHLIGKMQFNDLQRRLKYQRMAVYGQSKLANLLFAFELDRRLKKAGGNPISLAAHPGYSNTNLQHNSATTSGSVMEKIIYPITNRLVAQSAEMGTLPQLYAATAPGVKGGQYYGPRFLLRGYPNESKPTSRATNQADAVQLWKISEELTGVHYLS